MNPAKSPLPSPWCPVPSACGDRVSWPSPPKQRGREGWRLPGRFLPHTHESVSLQLSPGRERGSLPPTSPEKASPRGASRAGGSVLFAALHLGGGLLTWQPQGAPPAPGQSQGWGAGGHPLCSVHFTASSWQPWAPDRDRFCLPEPENVYSVPTWNTQAISLRTPDFPLLLEKRGHVATLDESSCLATWAGLKSATPLDESTFSRLLWSTRLLHSFSFFASPHPHSL